MYTSGHHWEGRRKENRLKQHCQSNFLQRSMRHLMQMSVTSAARRGVDKTDILPTFSTDLIDELDTMYPPRCPHISDSERQIWMYAGARALVEMLISRKQKAGEISLVGDM